MTFFIRFIVLFSFFCVYHGAYSSSFRISPEELNKTLNSSSFIILDARSFKEYKKGHIPGALNFPISLTYENKQLNGKISAPYTIQSLFRTLGLNVNNSVIVYDNGELADAARLFWVLEVYGLKHVRVLNHGYDQWLRLNYPDNTIIPQVKPSNYIATVNHKHLASKFTTLLATRNTNQIIIDARPKAAYTGKTSTARRFGHIPTAINVPSAHNISYSNGIAGFKQLNELGNLYQNIDKDKKVIIYCAVGRVSATNYLALRELGYDVSNYDASWKEWGNDFKLPIEK